MECPWASWLLHRTHCWAWRALSCCCCSCLEGKRERLLETSDWWILLFYYSPLVSLPCSMPEGEGELSMGLAPVTAAADEGDMFMSMPVLLWWLCLGEDDELEDEL